MRDGKYLSRLAGEAGIFQISSFNSENMGRSIKKGSFIDQKLLKKVMMQKQTGDKSVIKTWARASEIPPDFVGHSFGIHNGKNFVTVFVVESMVGHRLGEFAQTRTFRSHGRVVAREISKT